MVNDIIAVTVTMADGGQVTFPGKGVLREVASTRKVEHQDGSVTTAPVHYVTVTLDLNAEEVL